MIIAGGHKDIRGGTRWIGDKGWVQVDRGVFETSNPDFLKTIQKREGDKIVEKTTYKELPDELAKVRLEKSPRGHQGNFIDCVKSRGRTLCPVETGHHSAIPGHLALISMITGRKIKWDPDKEEIIGDEEATKLMGREYRGPWKLA
jgi:hypothetical protein